MICGIVGALVALQVSLKALESYGGHIHLLSFILLIGGFRTFTQLLTRTMDYAHRTMDYAHLYPRSLMGNPYNVL